MRDTIGYVPSADDINVEGLDIERSDLEAILTVDNGKWLKEAEGIEEFYKKFGDRLPKELSDELNGLKERLSK